MQAHDTTITRPTIRTLRSRPSGTSDRVDPPVCTRRPSRVPPRRADRVFTTGQLSGEAYAHDAMEARTSGTWL
jgi:hypothetical protein